jgi:hypothetical protein
MAKATIEVLAEDSRHPFCRTFSIAKYSSQPPNLSWAATVSIVQGKTSKIEPAARKPGR